jgi:hypothetical protein
MSLSQKIMNVTEMNRLRTAILIVLAIIGLHACKAAPKERKLPPVWVLKGNF